MECQIRKAQQAEAFKINGQAKWAEGWNRKNNLKGATTEGIKARQEEIQMANRELVILRKARMQKLYEEDLKGYVYSLVVYYGWWSRSRRGVFFCRVENSCDVSGLLFPNSSLSLYLFFFFLGIFTL